MRVPVERIGPVPSSSPLSPPPAPPPPTEPVPLAALLGTGELGLRLSAGAAGVADVADQAGVADVAVHGVHASEMPDPSPYLLGGELLLTAGAGLAGTDAGEYVRRLVRAGVAALGFGVTPVHETVPQGLAAACARHALPLVEVPPGTPFTAVARAVWRLMAEARTRELRRVTEAQQALAAAAARPDPIPAVLRRLSTSLSGWAALLSPGHGTAGTGAAGAGPGGGGREPLAAGVGPGVAVRGALEALAARVAAGGAATATDTLDGTRLAAYAVGGSRVLVLATPGHTPGDHTIASAGAVLLALLTAPRPAGGEAAALTRLLLDGDPAAALGPGPWYAVRGRGAGDPGALAAALGTVLLDARGDDVRLLTEREPGPQPGWRLGVSAPSGPAGLAAADAQAARALDRAEAARTPLARHADPGFAGLVGEREARAHAEALLAPLGRSHAETLRAWLAHHGSWDRTAAALGVHRNTVRQRIARCAVLLERDLDDPDTRMELWFALRWRALPPGEDR